MSDAGIPPRRKRGDLRTVNLVVQILGGVLGLVVAVVSLYFTVIKPPEPPPSPDPPTQARPSRSVPAPASVPPSTTPTTGKSKKPPTETIPPDDVTDVDDPEPEPPTTRTRKFTLSVEPGIAYDLEDLSNHGWDGSDAGYAGRDLYRTSETAGNNRLQGVQVPVTSTASSSYNAVVAVKAGSGLSACDGKSTAGGSFVSLDAATKGTTFCVRTRAGNWALVVITKMAGRTAPIDVSVTMKK